MADYTPLELEVDADAIAQEAFDYIASKVPGWVPAEGNIETILVESQALEQSVVRSLAAQAADDAFRRFGEIAGIPALEPTAATVTSTWTMVDTVGYTIPEGTQVAVDDGAGSQIGFKTLAEVVVPFGADVTAVGGVTLQAVETGARTSGLSGAVVLIDALAYIDSIVLVGSSTGGTDGETTAAFLDRLSERLRLQSAAAILPRDFEVLARDIAGVARATSIDLYDASTGTPNQEGHITLALVDTAGQPVPSGVKTAVDTLLNLRRVLDVVVHLIDPTYTAIDVTFTATALVGFDIANVEANAEAAVVAYLDPANWGLPTSGDGDTDWINRTTVRYLEVAQVINNVEGVDYLTGLSVEGGAADVALSGIIAMTTAGTIAGTIEAP